MQPRSFAGELRIPLIERMMSSINSSTSLGQLLASSRLARDQTLRCQKRKVWSFSNKGSWVISSPAVLDGKVYFATSDTGLLHAFDAKSGAPLFSLDLKHWPMFSSPAIAGGTLYIGTHQGRLNAIDLKTQKVARAFETEDSKKNAATYTKSDGSFLRLLL